MTLMAKNASHIGRYKEKAPSHRINLETGTQWLIFPVPAFLCSSSFSCGHPRQKPTCTKTNQANSRENVLLPSARSPMPILHAKPQRGRFPHFCDARKKCPEEPCDLCPPASIAALSLTSLSRFVCMQCLLLRRASRRQEVQLGFFFFLPSFCLLRTETPKKVG